MNTKNCELNYYDDLGNSKKCGRIAVVIWESRDGPIHVCEQCEALILELAKSAGETAAFNPLSQN